MTTVTGRDHSASAIPRAIAFQPSPSSTPSAWQTRKHISPFSRPHMTMSPNPTPRTSSP